MAPGGEILLPLTAVNTPGPREIGLRDHYHARNERDQKWAPDLHTSCHSDAVMDEPISHRPDIKYLPDERTYNRRLARLNGAREQGTIRKRTLPDGFYAPIQGERVWSGREGFKAESALVRLSPQDVTEVEEALHYFRSLPGDNGPDQMSKDMFPLPVLGPRLELLAKDLHTGKGLCFLRGLQPWRFSEWDNVLMYVGVASYFGDRFGCQDGLGNMLVHLVDYESVFGVNGTRPDSFTAREMPFHTDVGDLLCMYVLDVAPEGGQSTFASSAAVFNEIAATRPETIDVLARDNWYYDVSEPPGEGHDWPHRSLLFNDPEHGPFFIISRRKLTGADDFKLSFDLPAMSEEQALALDMVHFVAKKHSIAFEAQPGDLMFCNNLNLLHGRNKYSQFASDQHKRHFMRLWLRNSPLAWQTPEGLEDDWFKVYGQSARRGDAIWQIRAEDINKRRVLNHKYTCWN